MSKSYSNLREDFIFNRNEPEYRHAYAEESLDLSIGTQIKVLREQRNWRQEDLGREANIPQPGISRYENVNYSNWSINTLKKLARGFDVWLDVRFRSFGDLVRTTEEFSRESLQVPRFADDPFFKVRPKVVRPKIRAAAQAPNTIQIIPIDTRQPITLRNPVTGATQLRLWDTFANSGARPQLVEPSPQPQGNTSLLDESMKAAVGAGGIYGR